MPGSAPPGSASGSKPILTPDATHPVAGDAFPLERLESYLRERMPLPPEPLRVEQFVSGHSNLTYLLRCGGEEWVLRRPPEGKVARTAHDMKREFRFMSTLYAAYPLVPRSLLYCDDDAILGVPFHVVEYRRGVILRGQGRDGGVPTPAVMTEVCRSLVEGMAQLHALDYVAVGLADAGRPAGYAERQISGWSQRYLESATDDIPEMTSVVSWLAAHVPSPSSAAIVHNDFKFDNLLLDPEDLRRIVGVLDWEMAAIGDPLMDLGTTLALWVERTDDKRLRGVRPGPSQWAGSLTRAEVVACYAAASGRAVTDPVFYYCYGLFKLAVIFQQSYARHVRGETRDERFAGYGEKIVALARQAAATLEMGRL